MKEARFANITFLDIMKVDLLGASAVGFVDAVIGADFLLPLKDGRFAKTICSSARNKTAVSGFLVPIKL